LVGSFAISLALIHPIALALFEASRPVIDPLVMLSVDGEGTGLITTEPIGLHCGDTPSSVCRARYAEGTEVVFTATIGEKSTFDGWSEDCGPQSWRGFRWAVDVLGEWVSDPELSDELVISSARRISDNPLQCRARISSTTRIAATFGLQPEEVDVEWVKLPDDETSDSKVASSDLTISLPDPSFVPENIIEPEILPDEMELDEAEPEPEPEPEIAQVEPPQPQPQQQPQPQPQKQPVEAPKLKSVEVADENEVEKAPDDAAFLSDKNRDVAEQTVAEQTNLEREQKGDKAFSEESNIKSSDIGAKEDEIAELEDTEPSDIEPQRTEETVHSGDDKVAEGVIKGDEGESGDEGDAGNDKPSDKPGVLAMRGIDGRGAPGGPIVEQQIDEGKGAKGDLGDGGRRGRRGTKGRRGIKTDLEFEDYKRIVGKQKVADEQKLAKRQVSRRRGRWEKKLSAIQSSLENFTPEVRPGNQTALKTRAAPFAVYIARMHRRIHKLWGFGFLEDLDDKSSTHAMNNWDLWTKLEIVINPDGTVDKMTIVKTSGVLPFDVAAMDTIYTAGPFLPPPPKIRSPDGKTYMHWAFHRDWRQCGTFGVQPFILAEAPQKQKDGGFSDGDLVKNRPRVRRDKPKPGEVGMPSGRSAASNPDAAAATARATANMPTPDDPRANHTANLWLTGFTKRDVSKMVKVSAAPFRSGERIVASKTSELSTVYKNILAETRGRPLKTSLLSPSQYRQTFGALPGGFESDGTELLYVVKLRSEQFTLVLVQSKSGDYRITGFYR
jgi:TonB family protein